MTRLIDADALKRRLMKERDASAEERKYGWEFEYNGWNGAILQTGCEAVENRVEAIPVDQIRQEIQSRRSKGQHLVAEAMEAILEIWTENQ